MQIWSSSDIVESIEPSGQRKLVEEGATMSRDRRRARPYLDLYFPYIIPSVSFVKRYSILSVCPTNEHIATRLTKARRARTDH